MTRGTRLGGRARILITGFFFAFLLLCKAAIAHAQEGEFTAFDFYVGGDYYGIAYGTFGEGWFSADNPQDLVKLLPAVRDPQAFTPLFSGRIEGSRIVKNVGKIDVDVNNFKIDVQVDREQSLVSAVDEMEQLGGGDQNPSVLNKLSLAGSGSTNDLDFAEGMSLSHETVYTKGRYAIDSAGNLRGEEGYDPIVLAMRQDVRIAGHELRAATGLLQTDGSLRFARTLDYMGLRLESNKDVLYRDQQLLGSILELFLPRRSEVQIFRDTRDSGRVLYSRVLEFGTVQIDTRNFPIGSYNIEIVTRDMNGNETREVRPFIKSQELAPRGKPVIGMEVGNVRDDFSLEDVPVAQASLRQRLTDWLDAGIAAAYSTDDQVYEARLNAQTSMPLFEPEGILELSLTGAVDGHAEPVGVEAALSWTGETRGASVIASKVYDRGARVAANAPGSFLLSDRESLNINFSTPIEIRNHVVSASFSAEFSRSSSEGSSYRYGPVFSYRLPTYAGYEPLLKLEYAVSDDDKRALATLSVRNESSMWAKMAEITALTAKTMDETTANAAIGFNGGQSDFADWRRNLVASIGLRTDPLTSNVRDAVAASVSGDLRYVATGANLHAYLDQNFTQNSLGRIGGEASTTMLWARGSGVELTGESVSTDAAFLVATLKGPPEKKIALFVNGARKAIAAGGQTIVLPMPIYQKSVVTAQPDGGDASFAVREKDHVVVGFPGNISYREFNVVKLYFLMGTLTDEAGAPLKDERFIYNDDVYYTDENGFFNLETSLEKGQEVRIATQRGYACTYKAGAPGDDLLVEAGDIACKKKTP